MPKRLVRFGIRHSKQPIPLTAKAVRPSAFFLDQWGLQCWGCEFSLPDAPRNRQYFDLDHLDPKSGTGTNRLGNRAILCGPCNRQKSDKLTLVALRDAVFGSRKQAKAHPMDLKQTSAWAEAKEREAILAREREENPLFTR